MEDWWHDKFRELKNRVNELDRVRDFGSDIDLFNITTDIFNISEYLSIACANVCMANRPPRDRSE